MSRLAIKIQEVKHFLLAKGEMYRPIWQNRECTARWQGNSMSKESL